MLILLVIETIISIIVLSLGIIQKCVKFPGVNTNLYIGPVLCLGSVLLIMGYINNVPGTPTFILAAGAILWEYCVLRNMHESRDWGWELDLYDICELAVVISAGFEVWAGYMIIYTSVMVFLVSMELLCLAVVAMITLERFGKHRASAIVTTIVVTCMSVSTVMLEVMK